MNYEKELKKLVKDEEGSLYTLIGHYRNNVEGGERRRCYFLEDEFKQHLNTIYLPVDIAGLPYLLEIFSRK